MLVGCNSIQPTPFAEADNYGDIGYSEKKLSDDQYQVIFTGNAKTKRVSSVAPQSTRLTQVNSTCGIFGCIITSASNYKGVEVHFDQVADKLERLCRCISRAASSV